MRPDFLCRTEQKELEVERSNLRYAGIISSVVGFILLVVSIMTGGKFPVEYGIITFLAPVLTSLFLGFLCGLIYAIFVGAKVYVGCVVEFYTGYTLEDISKKIK